MIEGAIFDVDGTLLDSMYIWDTIGEIYLRSIGYTPKENLNETFKNMSLYQAACYYQKEYGVKLSTAEIMQGVNQMIAYYYQDEVLPKPDVDTFLESLKAHNVKMCIATATDREYVEAALERCKIRNYFSEIFTCTSVGHGKDEPIIYRSALDFLQTDRRSTVVFEDALYAIKTAKADGFVTVAVQDKYEKNQDEIKRLSDYYLRDYGSTKEFWKFVSMR
ncbi:MAG: HAD family phosphatase [Clostridium sp.]|nr:HAD family phosphatase [Clostridium sp.]